MIEKVIEFSTSYFELEKDDLLSDSRKNKVCVAKHVIMYYLHKDMNVSLSKIARMFKRKIWIVSYAMRKIDGWLEYNVEFKEKYYAFKHDLEDFLKKE